MSGAGVRAAGIGKSAVVGEAAAAAQGRGAWVAWGWGWQGEGTPAYWPWMQVFRSPAAQDGQLRRLFAALARRQADVDRFLGVMTGAVPLAEFFAARNMLRLLGVRGLAAMALRGRRQAAAG
jgi:hypothetical protein